MKPLERVLRAAMAAPGNRDRLAAAGLIEQRGDRLDLVDDWPAAFTHLRPIAREEIRRAPGQFLASVEEIVYRGMTSATRGQFFVYFADAAWNRARVQARQTSLQRWGIDEATPILNVGSRLLPVRPVDRAIAGPLTPDLLNLVLEQLRTTGMVIRGYPSRLCDLAAALIGQPLPPVAGVIATGEGLFEMQRALLQRVFGVPVINEYGCQESGISGLTCPEAGRLHLDGDRCLYEILDGQLVSTDLFNRVMPMVRYQCGDVLHLHDQPCPCGRPGPTAVLRGRVEDRIRTRQGIQFCGDVSMPALPGILHYRALRAETAQITLQVCPDPTAALDVQPLKQWAMDTFGETDVNVLVNPSALLPSPPISRGAVPVWIDQVTLGPWSDQFHQPQFPDGEARPVAQLLQDLMHPGVMLPTGLPPATRSRLEQICYSRFTDPPVEQLAARIVLYACSFLPFDPAVAALYHEAVQRLQPLLTAQPDHPAQLDRLLPTLFLETEPALAIWTEWLQAMEGDRPTPPPAWSADTLTFQHTLQALEAAVQRTGQPSTSRFRSLRPVLSLLIGDLSFFAPRLAPWLLGGWFELLHQCPLPPSAWLQPPDAGDFDRCWRHWRQGWLQLPAIDSPMDPVDALAALQAAARSPQEQERVALERGYGQVLQGATLHPPDWIALLHHLPASQGPSGPLIDLVPWHPILKALVQPLFAQGHPDLAYDCLRAVTVPCSRVSAFERFAAQQNRKQAVLYDLFCQ